MGLQSSTLCNLKKTDAPGPFLSVDADDAIKTTDSSRIDNQNIKTTSRMEKTSVFDCLQKSACRKTSPKETEEELTSPAVIRRQKLEEFIKERPSLDDKQLNIIQDTWSLLQGDINELGYEMFVRLFKSYPDVKGAFGPFRNMSAEDKRYSQELRSHGGRVLGAVEYILKNRDNKEELVRHLHELGNKHVSYSAKVDYIDIIGQQFLFAIEPVLKEQWSPDVEQAWADLFRFITHVMKEAMML